MDNKIILDLVAKNLEEIKLLVESLRTEEKADPLLIEITVTKSKLLYQELMLLLSNEPLIDQKHQGIVTEETSLPNIDNVVIVSEETSSPDSNIKVVAPEETFSPDSEIETFIPTEPDIESEELFDNEDEIEEVVSVEPLIEDETTPSTEIETNEFENPEIPVAETEAISKEIIEDAITENEVETKPIHDSEPGVVKKENEIIKEIQEPKSSVEKNIDELSVNEKLAATSKHESKIKGIPVTNIMNAIGINDRFQFTRELFLNDSKKFEDTVNHLDHLNNFLEAIDYLEANFKWTKNEASLKFMDLLKRRFEN